MCVGDQTRPDDPRGMRGSRSISSGNRLELRPFVSEFRCATLSNGQQRESVHLPTCLTFQPILVVSVTTGRYS